MMTRANDKAVKRGQGDFVGDIGQSGFRLAVPFTSEQHLMRLSGDPLLVREFVLRGDFAGPLPQVAPPMSGDVSIALARGMPEHGGMQQASQPPRPKHYAGREPLLEASASPSVFEPTCHDRDRALQHDNPRAQEVAFATATSSPSAALSALMVAAVLMLLLLMLFPD
jgi:hypothetical protein